MTDRPDPSAVTVRASTDDDVPGIVQVYVRAYAQPPWNEQNDPIASEAYLRWAMRHPRTYCLVAVVDDRIAGFILAGERGYSDFVDDWQRLADPQPTGWPLIAGRLGYVWEIAVDPDVQRRGIGGALLSAAVDQLRRDGVQRLVLRSSERAEAAVALYRRFGFQRLPLRERADPLAGPWLLELD